MILYVNSIIRRKDAQEGGLIGGFFRFAVGGRVYGVTCKHVIAKSEPYAVGDILTDKENNPIGTLSHWLILESKKINKAEFALFKPIEGLNTVWTKTDPAFKPAGFAAAALNSTVDFVNDDGITHGSITDLKHSVNITWNNVKYEFTCIELESTNSKKFSKPGHSGGAVYIGKSLLGIILGIGADGAKTYIMPYVDGILSAVDLKLI
jgi:hypothetical protein